MWWSHSAPPVAPPPIVVTPPSTGRHDRRPFYDELGLLVGEHHFVNGHLVGTQLVGTARRDQVVDRVERFLSHHDLIADRLQRWLNRHGG